jgi:hypothetical protein
MCLNHGSIDMDFVYGETEVKTDDDEVAKELFEGISVILKDTTDVHKLERVLEYQLEFEDTP